MSLRRAAALWVALPIAACSTPARDEDRLAARVDAVVAPLVAAQQFSGAIVLMRAGRVVYQRGFGMANHAAGLAFAPDTPSDGGSMAKTFTAAGVWWLASVGRIDLDAPVTRYVSEFPHARTTVRHLIGHSNGLPPYYEFFDPYFAPGEIRSTEALLRVVAAQQPRPSFEPGSRFEYSNFGFDVASLVIERVTGQPYERFLRERFLDRFSLQASFTRPARLADWRGVRTLGYRWRNGAWQVWDVFDAEAMLGASNLYASALDLARWASLHATTGVLPADVVEAGQRAPLIAGKPSPLTGLSWYCDERRQRCHYTGALNAFSALAYWDRPRGEAVALVANSAVPPWQLISLQRGLVAALAERAADAPTATFVRHDPKQLATAAGHFRSAALGDVTLTLTPDGNGLRLRVGDGPAFDVFQVSREVFYVPGPDYWLAFSGAPSRLHLRSMYVDAVLERRP